MEINRQNPVNIEKSVVVLRKILKHGREIKLHGVQTKKINQVQKDIIDIPF